MTRRSAQILICLALLGSVSCAIRQARENLRNCEFDLEGLQLLGYSLSAVQLQVNVGIRNPNESEVVLDRMDFKVFAEGDEIGTGQNEGRTEIAPGQRAVVPLRVNATLGALGTALFRSLRGGAIQLRVEGTAYIETILGELPVPFTIEEEALPKS